MKFPLIATLVLLMLLVLSGYAVAYRLRIEHQAPSSEAQLHVTASFYPLSHVAEQIGGEYVSVTNLTPAGAEPHDVDPSARDIATLHDADIFLYNGAGLEPWVPKVLPELIRANVRVVEATDGVALISAASTEESFGVDPHVWLDPVSMKQVVTNVASVFVAADPEHAKIYMERASAYTGKLDTLDQEFAKGLSTCKRHDIVTSHAAFAYLAQRYGLSMISVAGLSPDLEPTPAKLAEISRFVRDKGVTHIFFESLVSPKLAETIAHETGAQTLSLNPLEGLTEEEMEQGKTYISVQEDNLHALEVGLGCL